MSLLAFLPYLVGQKEPKVLHVLFWIKCVKYGGGSGHICIINISGHFQKILQRLFLQFYEEN